MENKLNTTLIGTKAYPVDNSYSLNIKTGKQGLLLAGTYENPGKLVTIVSEPYPLKLNVFGNEGIEEFVTVCFENELYVYLNRFSDNDGAEKIRLRNEMNWQREW